MNNKERFKIVYAINNYLGDNVGYNNLKEIAYYQKKCITSIEIKYHKYCQTIDYIDSIKNNNAIVNYSYLQYLLSINEECIHFIISIMNYELKNAIYEYIINTNTIDKYIIIIMINILLLKNNYQLLTDVVIIKDLFANTVINNKKLFMAYLSGLISNLKKNESCDKKEIINYLNNNQSVLKKLSIDAIYLIGSFANNNENEYSDIDLLIEYSASTLIEKKNINNILYRMLNTKFNRNIDITDYKLANQFDDKELIRNMILIYKKE